MAGKDIIAMSQGELQRLHIVHQTIDKELKQVEAAEILDLSVRQMKRIVKQVREEGDSGLAHKLRGKQSNRAIAGSIKEKVLNLYKEKYPDFGPLLVSEKLFEIDKITISDETLRIWLLEKGLWQRSRKRKKRFGEMIQVWMGPIMLGLKTGALNAF